jgi:hypothetical protein
MADADRRFLMDRLMKYLRALGWLIFFLALAFYLQQLQQQWAIYLSVVSLILASLSLRRQW